MSESPQRAIFTLTTGRSGTKLVSSIFENLPGCDSGHERLPSFTKVMRKAQKRPSIAERFWREEKRPAVMQSGRDSVYVETSHLFIKGFAEIALRDAATSDDLQIDLIHLTRPAAKIAASMYALDTIPGRNKNGRKYYLAPDCPAVALPLPDWKSCDDLTLCLWYVLEVEARIERLRLHAEAAGARIVQTSIAKLKSFGADPLLAELGLPKAVGESRTRIAALLKSGANAKSDKKTRVAGADELQRSMDMLIDRVGSIAQLLADGTRDADDGRLTSKAA